jgi:WD40 repeat protein
MHPESKNQIYVHSRDNCIRLIDYETSRGTRIKKRFFGAKCNNYMIRSALSPDGQYLVSGSETGQPYMWDASLEQAIDTSNYECNFMDVVSDCAWNPRYNMFACSGFGQEFPILVYVYQREKKEIEEMFFKYGKLTSQTDARPDLSDPQNQELVGHIVRAAEEYDQQSDFGKKSVRSERGPHRSQNNSFGDDKSFNFNSSAHGSRKF